MCQRLRQTQVNKIITFPSLSFSAQNDRYQFSFSSHKVVPFWFRAICTISDPYVSSWPKSCKHTWQTKSDKFVLRNVKKFCGLAATVVSVELQYLVSGRCLSISLSLSLSFCAFPITGKTYSIFNISKRIKPFSFHWNFSHLQTLNKLQIADIIDTVVFYSNIKHFSGDALRMQNEGNE